MNPLLLTAFSLWLAAAPAREVAVSDGTLYYGICDGSAGVALNSDLFLVANDEGNTLRTYSIRHPGAPVSKLNLDSFLHLDRGEESDLEGAARIGDMIYFITSHSRNRSGRVRASRHRFFAVRLVSTEPLRIEPVGHPYELLLDDLANAPALKEFNLEEASRRAPKEKNAFNIEGLCAGPDGSLMIGFRNPVPRKHALLVPLLNPGDLVTNFTRARFGVPQLIDLKGRGIRDIVRRGEHYYIIAGAYNSADKFEMYKWNGVKKPVLLHKWDSHTLHPEAILALPGPREFLVLSDDGSQRTGGVQCKDLPEDSRSFRAVLIDLE